MKVYNQDKQLLETYDLEKGYLEEKKEFVEEVKEQSHRELIAEYENGGKSYKRVIDVEYQPAHEETYAIYIPYTEEELHRFANEKELDELHIWFDTYYAQHEQKYRRLMTLGTLDDDGVDPNNKILDLYNEAEPKRKRIQELEK